MRVWLALLLLAGCAYDPKISGDVRVVCRSETDCAPGARCLPLPGHETINVCTTSADGGVDATGLDRSGAEAGADRSTGDAPIDQDLSPDASAPGGSSDAPPDSSPDAAAPCPPGTDPDCAPIPTAIATPDDGATEVQPTTTITLRFSGAMNPATVNATTVTLTLLSTGAPVASTITYADGTATVTPADRLVLASSYVLAAAAGIQDASGHTLGGKRQWTFTTRDGAWTANALPGPPVYELRLAVSAGGNAAVVWPANSDNARILLAGRYSLASGWRSTTLQVGQARWPQQEDVALDEAGNATAFWEYNDAVYSASSGPDGLWSMPLVRSMGSSYNPRVTMPAAGRSFGVWEQSAATGTLSFSSFQGASSGSDIGTVADQLGSAIAIAGAQGQTLVLWQQVTGMRTDVWANATGFASNAVAISDQRSDATYPALAMDVGANAMAAWQQVGPAFVDVRAARKTNGGAWTAATRISDGTSGAARAQLAADAQGAFVAVWQQSDGALDSIRAARWQAASGWSAPVIISDRLADATLPSVALDAVGNGLAVWQQASGMRIDVWAARLRAGVWQPPALRSNGVDSATQPRVGLDRLGRGFAAWAQSTVGAAVHRFE